MAPEVKHEHEPAEDDAPISVPDSGDTGESGKLKMIVQLVKKCLGVKDIASMFVSILSVPSDARSLTRISTTQGGYRSRPRSSNPSQTWSTGCISIAPTFLRRKSAPPPPHILGLPKG
jgi:hypothetical protein